MEGRHNEYVEEDSVGNIDVVHHNECFEAGANLCCGGVPTQQQKHKSRRRRKRRLHRYDEDYNEDYETTKFALPYTEPPPPAEKKKDMATWEKVLVTLIIVVAIFVCVISIGSLTGSTKIISLTSKWWPQYIPPDEDPDCPEKRVLLSQKDQPHHKDRWLIAVKEVTRRRLLRTIMSGGKDKDGTKAAEGGRELTSWKSKSSKSSKSEGKSGGEEDYEKEDPDVSIANVRHCRILFHDHSRV